MFFFFAFRQVGLRVQLFASSHTPLFLERDTISSEILQAQLTFSIKQTISSATET